MKKCIFFFLMFVSCVGFSQTIYNSQQIGQTGRNQNVSRGFWVKSDTLLTTAAVWIPANGGTGKVFTSDANGFGTWQNAINGDSTIAWSLTGNSGTNPATNFIGTTDANPLYIRANNKTGILVDTATNCLTLYNNESLINTLRGFGFLNNNLLIANQNPINNQFGYLKYGANDGFAYYIADNAGVGSAFGLLSNGGNGSQVSNAVFYDRKVGVKTAFQSGVYSVGGQRDGNTEISIIDDTLGIDVASIQGFRPDYSPFFDIKLWDTTGTTSFNIVRLQNIGHNFRMNLTGVAADTISITKGVGVGVLVSASSTNITNKLFSSSFQYTDGTQGAGKVLTSDADGNATWGYSSLFTGTIIDSVDVIGGASTLTAHFSNIIVATGAITSATLTLPSSPTNEDIVGITLTQTVGTLTFAGGTVVGFVTSTVPVGALRLKYFAARNVWYQF